MKRIVPRATLMILILKLGACATTPPPSRFSGVSWYDGRKFVLMDAFVRNGKFVRTPSRISETISLEGLYAASPEGRPLPKAGMPADFDLFARPPERDSVPVARIRGGKRVN